MDMITDGMIFACAVVTIAGFIELAIVKLRGKREERRGRGRASLNS